jgi:hypothetical protein
MQVRIGLVVFRDKLPPYSVRLSVRTLGFHPSKSGSIPLQSARFNCIGLPMPVGCMSISYTAECGCVVLSRTMETKLKSGYGGHAG